MTLILKLDLDMVKLYLHTKNEVFMSRGSKVRARTDRNTDKHTHTHTDRHDRKHYLPAYAGGNEVGFKHLKIFFYLEDYCKSLLDSNDKRICHPCTSSDHLHSQVHTVE